MSEELTLKCKCGAIECKFDKPPRLIFNCHCHSCVAAKKAIEGKEGFKGISADVQGGVGCAVFRSNNVQIVKASSDGVGFVKIGDKGPMARSYCTECKTMVFNVFLPNWAAANRNCLTNSDGSAYAPEAAEGAKSILNINCKHAFDPSACPEPKHDAVPFGILRKFLPIIFGLFCDGSNKGEAFLPEDMDKVEVVPITWE